MFGFSSYLKKMGTILIIGLFLETSLSAILDVENYDKNQSEKKVVIFLSHKCTCSNAHSSHLRELSLKFTEFQFYGVISEKIPKDQRAEILKIYEDYSFPFPIIEDNEQVLLKRYKALKTPHVLILIKSEKGEQEVYQGGITDAIHFSDSKVQYLNENLKALKTEGRVIYSHGRSLGCYIRRI